MYKAGAGGGKICAVRREKEGTGGRMARRKIM